MLTFVFNAIVISMHYASRQSTPNCAELLQPHHSFKIACHSKNPAYPGLVPQPVTTLLPLDVDSSVFLAAAVIIW